MSDTCMLKETKRQSVGMYLPRDDMKPTSEKASLLLPSCFPSRDNCIAVEKRFGDFGHLAIHMAVHSVHLGFEPFQRAVAVGGHDEGWSAPG